MITQEVCGEVKISPKGDNQVTDVLETALEVSIFTDCSFYKEVEAPGGLVTRPGFHGQ